MSFKELIYEKCTVSSEGPVSVDFRCDTTQQSQYARCLFPFPLEISRRSGAHTSS